MTDITKYRIMKIEELLSSIKFLDDADTLPYDERREEMLENVNKLEEVVGKLVHQIKDNYPV